MKLLWVLSTVLFVLIVESKSTYVIHEQRDEPRSVQQDRARTRLHPDTILPMRIALQPNKHAQALAESWLREVADPDSQNFGQFWSEYRVHEAFRPTDKSLETVTSWLSRHGIEYTQTDNKQWLAFNILAKEAEALIQAEYFEQVLLDGRIQISCDKYSLPEELREHIDFIKPAVKVITTSKQSLHHSTANIKTRSSQEKYPPLPPPFPKHPPKNPNNLTNCDREVTPACVRALYGIDKPDPDKPVSANNSLGVFEEFDLYYQGDLDSFYEALAPNIPAGTAPLDLLIDGAPSPPSGPRDKTYDDVEGESNLDLMSALPIIYPQNATIYQTDDLYYERQISYGSHGLQLFDDFLDAIDGSYCTYEGGNDPGHDPVYPDPHSGGYKGKLQCGTFKPTNVISISWGADETYVPVKYQLRQCREFMKLALRGVSVFVDSGDNGADCLIQKTSDGERQLRIVQEPAGCPWITSVGGTQIGKDQTVNDPETAASFGWADYPSGGGFSNLHERPWYQEEAVQQYFKASNNLSDTPYYRDGKYRDSTGFYNRDGRGVPDVSAISSNIAIWLRGKYTGLSGTSASTPIVAAMFNRIIEERIRAGKRGPLGLVNPTIYKHSEIWTDVVKGNNGYCNDDFGNRTSHYGPSYGYNCTEGRDPVTGLGTPKYPELLKVFMDLP